jgi:putative nucleotidyltransferase with HDIG domain
MKGPGLQASATPDIASAADTPLPPISNPKKAFGREIPVWLRRLFRKVTTPGGISILYGLLLVLLVVPVLSLDYLAVFNLVREGVSSQDVYAPQPLEVVDETATNRKIFQARHAVPLIYRDPEQINNTVRDDLTQLVKSLQTLEADPNLDLATKRRQAEDLLGNGPDTIVVFEQIFSDNTTLPADVWDRIRLLARVTTDHILKQGLSADDYFSRRDEIIRRETPRAGLSGNQATLVRLIVENVLQPNRVIDEEAMLKSRKQAEDQVKPTVRFYKRGEKIVSKGEPITSVQASALELIGKSVRGVNYNAIAGVSLLALMFTAILWAYLYLYEEKKFFKPTYTAMLTSVTAGTMITFKFLQQYQEFVPIIAFPLAAYGLIISIFTHPRVGVLATTLVVLLLALCLKMDFSSLCVLLVGSVVGVFVLSRQINFSDRSHLMLAALYVALVNMMVVAALFFMRFNEIEGNPWIHLLLMLICASASGLFSGIITVGMLPYLETVFGLVTPYTLMELANHDKPLLKRMQFEAPGTFHHSLMVASLAEAAAEAIGANPLLTRVGALYHDIGKMKRPLFFIENQAYFGVENPHDKLTPRLSKMVICAHPKDSLEMARQHRIPEVIQKFMTEHHGTMTAGYFYNRAVQEEGIENVNKDQFRYTGPKPNIRETAIVMLADGCESATRALRNPTQTDIEARVDKIIQQRIEDNQFDDCPITFRDLHIIRNTFIRVLKGIRHNRIEYQENVMKELGKKFPAPTAPTDAGESTAQGLVPPGSANGAGHDGNGRSGEAIAPVSPMIQPNPNEPPFMGGCC